MFHVDFFFFFSNVCIKCCWELFRHKRPRQEKKEEDDDMDDKDPGQQISKHESGLEMNLFCFTASLCHFQLLV